MRKRSHGKHLDTGEIRALAIEQLRESPPLGGTVPADYATPAPISPEETLVTQYIVFGEPGQEPQVAVHQIPSEETHTNQELTGSIAGVNLAVHGDGSAGLQVCGYHLDEARAQWDIAAATIGSFRINPFPAPAEGQVICVYCGGRLFEANPPAGSRMGHYLHTDDSPYCANSTGSVAYPVRLVARGSRPASITPTDIPKEI